MEILILVLFAAIAFVLIVSFAQRSEPLAAGQVAPQFVLEDEAGAVHDLHAEFSSRDFTVLAFFPRDPTSRCKTEMAEFHARVEDFRAAHAAVLFVALADRVSNARYLAEQGAHGSILADADGRASKAYGSIVDFWFYRFAKRSTFVIDRRGVIVKSFVVAEPVGHAAEVLALIAGDGAPSGATQSESAA
jgi:thioredoxin-dependent peroxiredoxin